MILYLLPIRNKLIFIKRTIDSILKQNYNGQEYEILVADDMSDDGTRRIIIQCCTYYLNPAILKLLKS